MEKDSELLHKIAHEIEPDPYKVQDKYKWIDSFWDGITSLDDYSFNIEEYEYEELCRFFAFFSEILSSDKRIIHDTLGEPDDENLKFPNRKLLQILKESTSNTSLDELITMLFYEDRGIHNSEDEKKSIDRLRQIRSRQTTAVNQQKDQIIKGIRGVEIGEGTNFYNEFYKNIKQQFVEQIVVWKNNQGMGTEWNPLDNLVSLKMFEELFSYFFLQTMMYQIIRNENLDHDTVVTVLEGIYKDILISTDDNSSLQNKSLFRDFAVYLFYLQKRKRYQDEIDVFKILIEQMENPEYSSHVAPEYKYGQWFLSGLDEDYVQKLILEGKSVRKDRYNEKLERTKNLIPILREKMGRVLCEDYLQHVKAVYRETILDKTKFEIRPGRFLNCDSIVKTIEAGKYPSFTATLFLREKISRGLFREVDQADFYILKSKIQIKYYQDILEAYNCTDEVDMAKHLKKVFDKYKKSIENALNICITSL